MQICKGYAYKSTHTPSYEKTANVAKFKYLKSQNYIY